MGKGQRKAEVLLLEFIRTNNIPISEVLSAIRDYADEWVQWYTSKNIKNPGDSKERDYWEKISSEVEKILQDPALPKQAKGW